MLRFLAFLRKHQIATTCIFLYLLLQGFFLQRIINSERQFKHQQDLVSILIYFKR